MATVWTPTSEAQTAVKGVTATAAKTALEAGRPVDLCWLQLPAAGPGGGVCPERWIRQVRWLISWRPWSNVMSRDLVFAKFLLRDQRSAKGGRTIDIDHPGCSEQIGPTSCTPQHIGASVIAWAADGRRALPHAGLGAWVRLKHRSDEPFRDGPSSRGKPFAAQLRQGPAVRARFCSVVFGKAEPRIQIS